MSESRNPAGQSRKEKIARIVESLILSGDKLTDEELQQMQITTDALERAQLADGHHDHDHPTIGAFEEKVAGER
jgi:hypothetical protein